MNQPSATWERLREHIHGPLIAVKYSGVYPADPEGIAFANAMVQFLERVLAKTGASAVIFDLTDLDYTVGDAICGLVTPLISHGDLLPAAFVAGGHTAQAMKPLVQPNFIFGAAGMKLFPTREEALRHIEQALNEVRTGLKDVANDRASSKFQADGASTRAQRSSRVGSPSVLRFLPMGLLRVAAPLTLIVVGYLFLNHISESVLQTGVGWVCIALGTFYFALKVDIARSHAAASGGGAPFLDGALVPPLMWCLGIWLLSSVYALKLPFRGFVFVCWILLTAASVIVLFWASRSRHIVNSKER